MSLAAEITHVCVPCGVKYLTEKQKSEGGAVTANLGHCGVCNTFTHIIHIRHYNYLNKPHE